MVSIAAHAAVRGAAGIAALVPSVVSSGCEGVSSRPAAGSAPETPPAGFASGYF